MSFALTSNKMWYAQQRPNRQAHRYRILTKQFTKASYDLYYTFVQKACVVQCLNEELLL